MNQLRIIMLTTFHPLRSSAPFKRLSSQRRECDQAGSFKFLDFKYQLHRLETENAAASEIKTAENKAQGHPGLDQLCVLVNKLSMRSTTTGTDDCGMKLL